MMVRPGGGGGMARWNGRYGWSRLRATVGLVTQEAHMFQYATPSSSRPSTAAGS